MKSLMRDDEAEYVSQNRSKWNVNVKVSGR